MRKFDRGSIKRGDFMHGGAFYSDGAFRRGEVKLRSVDGVPYDEHAPAPAKPDPPERPTWWSLIANSILSAKEMAAKVKRR